MQKNKSMKRILVASTSTVHGQEYLAYLLPTLKSFFNTSEIIFIPYARPSGLSYNSYTEKVAVVFNKIGVSVKGIHTFNDKQKAIKKAQGIFVGGGNTFELVNQLYKHDLMQVLKHQVESGTPYLGTSAGSNITGISMKTSNDMPVVYPPSFKTLGLLPFNINPHYLDPNPDSTHMGETRETRIKEFHEYNITPVLGLREGSWLAVNDDVIVLKGNLSARLFLQGKDPQEFKPETDFSFLI